MTFRFNKRIKLFPGIHLNIGKRGIGISAGMRGFHVGLSTTGRPYATLGIPHTGVYVREDFNQPKKLKL
jgi:hypothetical protein